MNGELPRGTVPESRISERRLTLAIHCIDNGCYRYRLTLISANSSEGMFALATLTRLHWTGFANKD